MFSLVPFSLPLWALQWLKLQLKLLQRPMLMPKLTLITSTMVSAGAYLLHLVYQNQNGFHNNHLGHHGLGYAGYYGYPYGYGYGYYGHPYAYWGRKKREATPTSSSGSTSSRKICCN